MTVRSDCPDCGVALERMELQAPDLAGALAIVSESSSEGLLGSLRADEVLTPVPYVCPKCRRTLCYAEE